MKFNFKYFFSMLIYIISLGITSPLMAAKEKSCSNLFIGIVAFGSTRDVEVFLRQPFVMGRSILSKPMDWSTEEKKWISDVLRRIGSQKNLSFLKKVLEKAFRGDSRFFRAQGEGDYASNVMSLVGKYNSIVVTDRVVQIKRHFESKDLFERIIAHELLHVFDAYVSKVHPSFSSHAPEFLKLTNFSMVETRSIWQGPFAGTEQLEQDKKLVKAAIESNRFADARQINYRISQYTGLPTSRSHYDAQEAYAEIGAEFIYSDYSHLTPALVEHFGKVFSGR